MNPEVLQAIGLATLFVAAFLGTGLAVLGRLGFFRQRGDTLRLSPVAFAVGFAVWSYVAYPLLALGAPHWSVVLAALLGGVIAGTSHWVRLRTELGSAFRAAAPWLTAPVPLLFVVLSAGFMLLVATQWLTPAREGDALVGYLFTARWLYAHGFEYSPYNTVYSLYPFNTETVFALTFAFGNDITAKVIDAWAGLFLLAVVFECANRYARPLPSFFAVASLAVMNGFATTWGSGKVDILCTLTLLSGFTVLVAYPERPSRRTLVVSAFLVGTACAQKYTAWVFAATFVAGLFLVYREPVQVRVRRALLVAGVIGVCLTPHFVKTLAWTGNPVAPFATTLIPTRGVYIRPNDIDFDDAMSRSVTGVASGFEALFFNRSGFRWPGPLPLFLVALPMALARSVPRDVRRLAGFGLTQILVWIAIRGEDWLIPRFVLAPVALLLIAAVVGFDRVGFERPVARAVAVVMMALLVARLGIWDNRDWRRSWPYVVGLESREVWYERIAPGRGYAAVRSVVPLLTSNRRLFLTASQYYVPVDRLPYISTEQEQALFRSMPEDQRLGFLREHRFGFVHIFDRIDRNPAWTKGLPIVAQRNDPAAGLEYTLFRTEAN